jgi:hypothetical protein
MPCWFSASVISLTYRAGAADCRDDRHQVGDELVGCFHLNGAAEFARLRDMLGLPSLVPLAFFAASAAFVRSDISRRSFSAKAA